MFSVIKSAVTNRFNELVAKDLFVVGFEKNVLFEAYLNALPEDERQHHTCNCCRSFLNHYGPLVTINGAEIETLWQFTLPDDSIYAKVPAALDTLIRTRMIDRTFVSDVTKLGTDFNRERLADGSVRRWEHFFGELPREKLFKPTDELKTVASLVGRQRTTKEVFQRGLDTLTADAVATVLDLIQQNNLYRGQEYRSLVERFAKLQAEYRKLNSDDARNLFAWANFKEGGKIRNTAIGTLLIDLSEGTDIEQAVKTYETTVVAPSSFRRSSALVTESMVQRARDTIETLGLTSSLQRRHATVDDIPLDHLLFVNRMSAAQRDAFDALSGEVKVNPKALQKAKAVTLDQFLSLILPNATSMQLYLENDHSFVSLIAPQDADAEGLFGWSNAISWSYEDNNADVLKRKVTKAGGKVEGELRISLEWFNTNDYDLHLIEPHGFHIYFHNKRSAAGGTLDVDMNVSTLVRDPVENIIYADGRRMHEGVYKVGVHNFTKRENADPGMNLEIECRGQLYRFSNPQMIPQGGQPTTFVEFTYSREQGITAIKSILDESSAGTDKHGLTTHRFHDVKMALFSPNHWTDEIGNKHLFLVLDKARMDTPMRPFFNEFLHPSLHEHRKVLEVLGGKMLIPPADEQLTGVGFSLTQRHKPVVKVNGALYRIEI